jgi:hypothetical protein
MLLKSLQITKKSINHRIFWVTKKIVKGRFLGKMVYQVTITVLHIFNNYDSNYAAKPTYLMHLSQSTVIMTKVKRQEFTEARQEISVSILMLHIIFPLLC